MVDNDLGNLLITGETVQASFQGPLDFFALKGGSTSHSVHHSLPGSPGERDSAASSPTLCTASGPNTRLSSSSSASTFAPFARLQSLSHSISASAVSSPMVTGRTHPPPSVPPPLRSFSSLSSWEAVDWPSNEALTTEPRTVPIRTSSVSNTGVGRGPQVPPRQEATVAVPPSPSQAQGQQQHQQQHRQREEPIKPAIKGVDPPLVPLSKIVITNFRVFQVDGQSNSCLRTQVALDAISSVHHQGHRITISLKFDPCQYVICQQPWGPPMIVEIFSLLRHATTIHASHRFPFFYGPAVLDQHAKTKKEERQRRRKHGHEDDDEEEGSSYSPLARLWTAEEILDTCSESDSESDNGQERRHKHSGGHGISRATRDRMPPSEASARDDPLSIPQPTSNVKAQLSDQISPDAHRRNRILGWHKRYNLKQEFSRQGFDRSLWCVTNWNADYGLSPTYPTSFICPKSFLTKSNTMVIETKRLDPRQLWRAEQDIHQQHLQLQYRVDSSSVSHADVLHPCIRQLAEFRSNARFPVVCWKRPQSTCVLIRSSQPMVGFLGARGHADESFIRSILGAAGKQEAQRRKRLGISQRLPPPKLCIMDARGYSSAIANGVHGGGHENPDNYLNASIAFMSLANIHVIASSHQSLLKAVQSSADSTNWFSALENTAWLTHVSELLKAASGKDGVVGKMTQENCSVLVHCSDGWDRTTQLVSLAQIIMDPFFRTIQGLRILIEKEWLYCGHPFQSRTDCQQQRTGRHQTSNLSQEGLAPSSKEYSNNMGAWATGGPPVLLSSPNGKSECLSAMPNLSKFVRPHKSRVSAEATDEGSDTHGWTTPSMRFSNPFSRSNNHIAKQALQQGLPTSRVDISMGNRSDPLSDNLLCATTTDITEAFMYSSPSKHKVKSTKGARFIPAKNSGFGNSSSTVAQPKTNPSPVFLLFLTCLHHILEQYADHFEYNDYLLLLLAKAASGFTPFGDFMFNTERERAEARLRESTVSVWSWIDYHRGLVTNPGYRRRNGGQSTEKNDSLSSILEVQTGGRFISIWSEYYFDTLASTAVQPLHPSTIMSSPIFHPHAPTSRARNHLTTDFWKSTLLATASGDRGLKMPESHLPSPKLSLAGKRATASIGSSLGSPALRFAKDNNDPSNSHSQRIQSIEEHLDFVRWKHVRDQHEDEHLLLMYCLRRKRKARVEQIFVKWAEWAKRRREDRAAKDAGWRIVEDGEEQEGGDVRHRMLSSDEDEEEEEEDGEQDVYGRTTRCNTYQSSLRSFIRHSPFKVGSLGRESSYGSDVSQRSESHKRRTRTHTSPPELVIHVGKRGLTYEMERILDDNQEAFFGDHPVVLEEHMSEESEQEEKPEKQHPHSHPLQGPPPSVLQRMDSVFSEDGFDDFGFPVLSPTNRRCT